MMQSKQKPVQLAQSASALGAGILGFGLGVKWGNAISNFVLLIIIAGGAIHLFGMYIMQMKDTNSNAQA